MAIILIENNEAIKGYISLKRKGEEKYIEYYIENKKTKENDLYSIAILNGNTGYIAEKIHTKTNTSNNNLIFKGTITDNPSLRDSIEDNIGICIQNKVNKMVFVDYFKKREFNKSKIIIKEFANSNNQTKTYTGDKNINNKELAISKVVNFDEKNIIKDNTNGESVLTRDLEDNYTDNSLNKNEIENTTWKYKSAKEFIDILSKKATVAKPIKIDNRKAIVLKISYYVFKNAYIDGNQYYISLNTIVGMFKQYLKKYGHFILTVVLRRNGEIKSLQIGIPGEENEIDLRGLEQFKYKYFNKTMGGYWMYHYEI